MRFGSRYINSMGKRVAHPTTAKPLFYALSMSDEAGDNTAIVSLHEYRHTETEQRLYSTDPARRQRGWIRTGQSLCRVWKAPPGPLLLDRKAKPTAAP